MSKKFEKQNKILFKIKRLTSKFLFISFVIALYTIPFTKAELYNDEELSQGNFFSATNLNLDLTSEELNIGGLPQKDVGLPPWYPGSSGDNIFYVKNEGVLPFVYGLKFNAFKNLSDGDLELCQSMDLKVFYLFKDENDDDQQKKVYEGDLVDFLIEFDEGNTDLEHMVLPPDPSIEHSYLFMVNLPIEENDNDLADNLCRFEVVSYAWQQELMPYTGFWDEESEDQKIQSAQWDEPIACAVGNEVFLIGDIENEQNDNPVDELNWPGVFGEFPDFADPYVVGTNTSSEFPWNSNFEQDEATNFDVEFYYPGEEALAKLTVSWSPGRSGVEQKEIVLDEGEENEWSGQTPERTGESVDGWWENMPIFEDEFTFPLSNGVHTLNLKQLKGDGTLWDYVKLEIVGCGAPEGAVIINEVMWGGSSEQELDEWIELRNNTDENVDLTGWVIEGSSSSFHTVDLTGATIPANGYFLVVHYPVDHDQNNEKAAINDDLGDNVPVFVDNNLLIRDQGEKLVLKSATDVVIDETPDVAHGNPGWAAGEAGIEGHSDSRWVTMERKLDPGDGNDENNWVDCNHDECDDGKYWDHPDGQDYGTPGYENKYDEDPEPAVVVESAPLMMMSVPEPSLIEEPICVESEINICTEESTAPIEEPVVAPVEPEPAITNEEESVVEEIPQDIPPPPPPEEEAPVEEPAPEEPVVESPPEEVPSE